MAPADGSTLPLVKVEGDEGVDFGDDQTAEQQEEMSTVATRPKSEPQRQLPDYGDIIDGDDEVDVKVKEDEGVKEQGPAGDRRPEALYISGCQRLTRTHIAEVFESKDLPQFARLEWVGDADVICIFSSTADAAAAFRGAQDGFGDTMADDEEVRPGPGLWRAQRGMLDFRYATTEDKPDFGWKKQHRGGRQVREFRFWEAIKAVDQDILAKEDAEGVKRLSLITELPKDERPAKRARTGVVEQVDEEGDAFLEQMAKHSSSILSGDALPEDDDEDAPPWPAEWDQNKDDSWRLDYERRLGQYRAWPPLPGKGKSRKGGKPSGGKQGGNWGTGGVALESLRGRKRRYGDGHDEDRGKGKGGKGKGGAGRGGRATAPALTEVEVSAEELARRAKRNERFSGAAAGTVEASEPPAPNEEETLKRQRRAERFATPAAANSEA